MRRQRSRAAGLLLAALVVALAPASAEAQTKLLRFPDIHGDRVVFTYAGDLWTAPADGGTATRLTTHPGLELFARFSPDGRWIAFTGQYDGDEQVYVIPADGGVPRQLTYYPAEGPLPPRWGYDNQVYGWTPDGSAVLFRSLRDAWDLASGRLYTVPVDGGLPEALPMPESGAGAFSPDGTHVVYSPKFRDFRTWKRYAGGWAQDLWVFGIADTAARQITDHPRADRDPMWIEDRVYFTSDRSGTLNIYAVSPDGGTPEALTTYDRWDVRWPGDDGRRRIVFELGGELRVLDVETGRVAELDIRVPDDLVARRPSRIDVSDNIEDYALSPSGERALFVARGDVFTAPIEHGPTRNLTRSSGAHDKHARWSPDGRWIAFVSDMTGEEELYIVAQDGTGEPRQLTSGSRMMLYAPEWSPDGERIAYSDKEGRLRVVEVETGRTTPVADETRGQVRDYVWSPRGGWLAFTLSEPGGFGSVHVWHADEGLHRVTTPYFNEFNPSWDRDGDYLYFLADRSYPPQVGSFEWNYVVDRETYLYAVTLREDVEHPFPPRSDEVRIDEAGEAGEGGEAPEAADAGGPLRIDLDGITDRIVRLPVEPGNYGGLGTAENGDPVYVDGPPSYYGKGSGRNPDIMVFSMADRESKPLVEGAGGYALSADGSKLLVRDGDAFQLYGVEPGTDATRVSTGELAVDRVPAEEWNQ
ncbi:MAG: S41 family peptidase, partial [Gemmatimonadota bacterium]